MPRLRLAPPRAHARFRVAVAELGVVRRCYPSPVNDSQTNLPSSASTPRRGTSSLDGLLEALEELAEQHSELLDTAVRERLWEVIDGRIIKADASYTIPLDLGMFSDAANRKLLAILTHHLNNLFTAFDVCGLRTSQQRLHSFQNPHIKTPLHGYTYDDFFGSP